MSPASTPTKALPAPAPEILNLSINSEEVEVSARLMLICLAVSALSRV